MREARRMVAVLSWFGGRQRGKEVGCRCTHLPLTSLSCLDLTLFVLTWDANRLVLLLLGPLAELLIWILFFICGILFILQSTSNEEVWPQS